LEWWKEKLGLEELADLVGALPRVEKELRELETAGKTGKTLQNYSEGLTAFCDWCVTRGYLDGDPLQGLASFDTSPRTRRRALIKEEITRLLTNCAEHRKPCYQLALASGLRVAELRSLRVRHLDVGRGGLQLESAWTKNRKSGFQPLPDWLVSELSESSKDFGPDSPLVFVPTHTARDLDEDLNSAGIQKWTSEGKVDFHSLRVLYVSWILEAGASAKEAMALARHSDARLTMDTYARARKDRLAEVAQSIGAPLQVSTTEAQRKKRRSRSKGIPKAWMVEAAGVEPAPPQNANYLMARGFSS
jgi:integrase